MKDKLIQLRNTMAMIETRGESTMIMADCLKFLEQCIRECEQDKSVGEVIEATE